MYPKTERFHLKQQSKRKTIEGTTAARKEEKTQHRIYMSHLGSCSFAITHSLSTTLSVLTLFLFFLALIVDTPRRVSAFSVMVSILCLLVFQLVSCVASWIVYVLMVVPLFFACAFDTQKSLYWRCVVFRVCFCVFSSLSTSCFTGSIRIHLTCSILNRQASSLDVFVACQCFSVPNLPIFSRIFHTKLIATMLTFWIMPVYLLVLNMFLCAVAVASIIAFRITVFACDVIYPKSAILMADPTNSLGLIARCYAWNDFFSRRFVKMQSFSFFLS